MANNLHKKAFLEGFESVFTGWFYPVPAYPAMLNDIEAQRKDIQTLRADAEILLQDFRKAYAQVVAEYEQ